MSSPIGRRSFVVGGAVALAAGVAAACGKDDEAASTRSSISVTTAKTNQQLNMLVASTPTLAATPDERVALLLLEGQDAIPDTGPVQVVFGRVEGQSVGTTIGPFAAERHGDGLPRPYYLVHATFPQPGNYAIKATVQGREVLAALEAIDPASDGPPHAGQPLPSLPTPTPKDHQGVNPICTATPQCPLHDVSLDAALAEKRPIAVLLGTPAFCKTNTCGPVLDVMLSEMKPYADRVRFLHEEIYVDRNAKVTTPAVDAFKLPGEPFLFLAGPDGVVKQRLSGPYDKAEFKASIEKLLAS